MPARTQIGLFFDRNANEAAPFGPGTIVVAHMRIAQQVMQREPRMTAALADAAIGNDLFIGRHAFTTIDFAQLLRRFESSILAYSRAPGDIGRAWNVTTALCALLWQVCRRQQLAAILTRRTYIDQRNITLADLRENLVA